MNTRVRSEGGSALILAVMAMLILGVLGVSFALLADIESRVGVSYKQQAQAEALAEGALERARDAVRTAPTAPDGFTNWLNGTTANHMLFAGQGAGSGQYWARIDNDCAPAVVVAIQESPACTNVLDTNEVAVITAWAVAGSGRSRLRAIVGVDNPWKHVCSDALPDNNGLCNDPGNRNGNPSVSPADPGDPNGPRGYPGLPMPMLGCSRIDTQVHRGAVPLATQTLGCANFPQMYTSPYPVAYNVPPRFVVMGEDPAVIAGAKKCNIDPGNAATYYFGYFDCALSTSCDPALGHVCLNGALRKACVRAADTRVIVGHPNYDPAHYVAAPCGADTGMVFIGDTTFNTTVGSQTKQFDTYIHNGNWSQGNNRQFYGTLVVETNGAGGVQFAVGNGAATELWAGANATPPPAGWAAPMTYGFPIVALVYDPAAPPPTIQPTYLPQTYVADFGSNNTQIHGMIYSGGHVQFNPLSLDGTVVAFEIQTQGSASYNYNRWYGNNTPPAGFPLGSGNEVVIIRKSFVVCTNFNDDTGGPTLCS
jgi:Tfp pilus assembly protein PilX